MPEDLTPITLQQMLEMGLNDRTPKLMFTAIEDGTLFVRVFSVEAITNDEEYRIVKMLYDGQIDWKMIEKFVKMGEKIEKLGKLKFW